MKKVFVIGFVFFGLFACRNKSTVHKEVVAKVHEHVLTRYQLSLLMPKKYLKKDSVKLADDFIKQWALEQLLYKQALINLSDTDVLDKMVQHYKKQLYVHQYQKELLQEQGNQTVLAKEVDEYYQKNQSRFKLNEPLIQFKYIHLKKGVSQNNQIKKLFKSNKLEDMIALTKNKSKFQDFYLNDSTWVALQNVYAVQKDFPALTDSEKEKSRGVIEKKSEDGGVYYIKIQKFLKEGVVAPKVYVQSTIKEMLVQQNQLQFFNKLEKELLNDAIKEKKYEKF